MISDTSPIYIAAIKMALQRSVPGVVMINENLPGSILLQLMPFLDDGAECVRFAEAADIEHPVLKEAIASCDFSQYRLLAEAGKCYLIAIEELEKTLAAE
jgi:hypothetical protein